MHFIQRRAWKIVSLRVYLCTADREHYFLSCTCERIRTGCLFVAALLPPWKYLMLKPHSNVQVCVEKQCVGDPCYIYWLGKKKNHSCVISCLVCPCMCVCVYALVFTVTFYCRGTLNLMETSRASCTLGRRGACELRACVINKQGPLKCCVCSHVYQSLLMC